LIRIHRPIIYKNNTYTNNSYHLKSLIEYSFLSFKQLVGHLSSRSASSIVAFLTLFSVCCKLQQYLVGNFAVYQQRLGCGFSSLNPHWFLRHLLLSTFFSAFACSLFIYFNCLCVWLWLRLQICPVRVELGS